MVGGINEMVKLFTFSHKRSDFLDMQIKSFQRNLEEEYEFIVFNNANFDIDRTHYNEIHRYCAEKKIQCIDIQRNKEFTAHLQQFEREPIFNGTGQYGNSVIACAYPLCWAWKEVISKMDDKICIIDSDMFFIDKENISNRLNDYDIIYMPQSRGNGVYYMWNGILYMNLAKLPEKETINWWCGMVEEQPVDVGGHTFYYLREHRDKLKTLEFGLHYVGEDASCDFTPANYELFSIGDKKLLFHHRGGSNWMQASKGYLARKTRWLKNKFHLG